MINPTCPIHGEPQCRVDGETCTCLRITIITSDHTTASPIPCAEWSKNLKSVWDWSATLYGRIDGQKEPVPEAYQRAFKDGELDV